MSQADQETLLEEANEAAIHRALAFRASRYLLAGILCGMIGGVYSTYLCYAFSSDYRRHLNMEGEQFPSGKAYWPPSVSNMVNNIDSPQGKVWLAFMTTSAILTMVSWYPYQFQNVYIGEDVSLLPCLDKKCKTQLLSMMTARAFLPQLGMLMVALDHTADPNVWNPAQQATGVFHTGGAVIWIAVSLYTEMYTLACSGTVVIGKTERALRWACAILGLVGAIVYIVGQAFTPSDLGICCGVEYRNVTAATIDKAKSNGAFQIALEDEALMQGAKFNPHAAAPLYQGMYNTTSGWGLAWILMQFWSELCAGGFMLLDLLVIWYFAVERRIDKGPTLPEV